MKISQAAARIPGSPTLAIDSRAKAMKAQGLDVISFGAGEPDFNTPRPIIEAAFAALEKGETRYTAVGGTPALKNAIAAYTRARTGESFGEAEIIASCGAKHTLYNLFLCLLDAGDEVIVPTPAWVSYPTQIEMAGGVPVLVPGDAVNDFLPSIAALDAAVTPRTRILLFNNPSNPTGAFWDAARLAPIVEWLRAHPDIIVVSDAIYDELVYDGATYTELLTLAPELRPRYVLVNGVSKSLAMTGWRLGWACAPASLVAAMTRLQSQSTSNPTAVTQAAAAAGLGQISELVAPMRVVFERRRDLISSLLRAIPDVSLQTPRGAFYAFPDFSAYLGRSHDGKVLATDAELADFLLTTANVAVVPGGPFNANGFLRLSYATSDALIEAGVARIAAAVATLR